MNNRQKVNGVIQLRKRFTIMKIKILSALAFSMFLAGCQNPVSMLSKEATDNARSDNAVYTQVDMFTDKNGGIVEKTKNGMNIYTPFFSDDLNDFPQSEQDYLRKLSLFLNGDTIDSIRIIGYISSERDEYEMTKLLEKLEKFFSENGVSAPIKLTIGTPAKGMRITLGGSLATMGNSAPDKRFELDIITK